MMTATELFKNSSDALAVTGPAEWDSPDAPGQRDVLVYVDDEAAEDDPLWCLAPTGSDDADYVPMDTAMAQRLIESHLRDWQVQATIRKQAQRWRLVDCLSIADGGGDRLDDDYPFGDDELSVVCESVVVVALLLYVRILLARKDYGLYSRISLVSRASKSASSTLRSLSHCLDNQFVYPLRGPIPIHVGARVEFLNWKNCCNRRILNVS